MRTAMSVSQANTKMATQFAGTVRPMAPYERIRLAAFRTTAPRVGLSINVCCTRLLAVYDANMQNWVCVSIAQSRQEGSNNLWEIIIPYLCSPES